MEKAKEFPYVLGLDVGANSIGWAILERREGDKGRIYRPFRNQGQRRADF